MLASAAIDGTVVNATTEKPQPGVTVTLVHPGENGMQTLATVKSDAQGKFKIDQEVPSPPALLQSTYQGVTYNKILAPGAPSTGVRVDVYDSTKAGSAAKISQHMFLIEPGADALKITETILLQNDGNTTYNDPAKGTIQFYLPRAARESARVTVDAPGGMPIQRAPEETGKDGVYKVDYPAKPGETRYDVNYNLPAAQTFSGKGFGDAPIRLITGAPVTLSGDGITALGQEPTTQAHVYEASGSSFDVNITGTGPIQTASADSGQQQAADTGEPEITPGPARIYTRLYWVLGLTFGILALGGVLLYRRGTV